MTCFAGTGNMRKELWHAFPYLCCPKRVFAGTCQTCHAKEQSSTFRVG